MKWLNEPISDEYTLVGTITENIISLILKHPNGIKVVKQKHMSAAEAENIDFDEVRQYFMKYIDKVKSKTTKQLILFCGNANN